MLTLEQVRKHSEVYIKTDYLTAPECMARILYLHNDRLSRLYIICELPEPISHAEATICKEEAVKAVIDWEKFTEWINKHDDLAESNLLTSKEWSDYHVNHHERDEIGRDGILDTIRNKVIDCHKIKLE